MGGGFFGSRGQASVGRWVSKRDGSEVGSCRVTALSGAMVTLLLALSLTTRSLKRIVYEVM